MNIKSRKLLITLGMLCLVSVVAVLPFASACGPAPQPGQVLKVGISTSSTGPVAGMGAAAEHGSLDAIKYVNEELGGAWNYPIKAVWLDNSWDANKMDGILQTFMNEGCLMFTIQTGFIMTAIMEKANQAGFPGLVTAGAPHMYRPPQHIYGQLPDVGDDWLAFTRYYLKEIWRGHGKPRMALHIGNNAIGWGARDAAWAMFEELGIELVATEEHAGNTKSELESLTRIKATNPDVLYISSGLRAIQIIIQNAYELGMYPGMTIGVCHSGLAPPLIDNVGAEVVEGIYGVRPTASWGDNVPGMAKMMEYCNRLHPEDAENPSYMLAWAQGLIVAEALEEAVKNEGYHMLSKKNVESWRAMETKGIQKLKNFDVGGLHGPVSYAPGDNRLVKSVKVYQIRSGVVTPISDWIEAPVIEYEQFPWFGTR